jgi:hypothetical protein
MSPGSSRRQALLAALSDEPTSTSDLYDALGYPQLVRVGLVSYPAFRSALDALAAEGLAERRSAEDGSTLWRLPAGGEADR